jgi:tetratricopeptide (TPR) repeat protein
MFERASDEDTVTADCLYYLADCHRLIGLVEIDRKRLDKAEQELRRAVEIHQQCMAKFPGAMITKPERAQCYGDLNRLLVSAGRLQEAKSFITGIKIEPKDVELRAFRAGLLRDSGELQQAVAEYSEVLALAPQLADAWSGRAAAHFHLQQWDSAVADYSEAIELAPQVHTTWFHRGHAYLQLAQWDKAAADFTKVIEGWPDDSGGWFLRALAYAQLNQPEKAIADLRQAIAKGLKDVVEHLKNAMLDPLRSNEEFKKLLAAMEAKQK